MGPTFPSVSNLGFDPFPWVNWQQQRLTSRFSLLARINCDSGNGEGSLRASIALFFGNFSLLFPAVSQQHSKAKQEKKREMKITISFFNSLRYYFLIIAILHRVGSLDPVSAVCELSFVVRDKVYSFNLVSPLPNFPHGVLSEDGYSFALSLSWSWFFLSLNFLLLLLFSPYCACFTLMAFPAHCSIRYCCIA